MDIKPLKIQYSDVAGRAERLRDAMVEQLSKLLDDAQVTLGVPMESRVKEWSSIEEKIERKSLSIDDIMLLPDLIGIRAILLFRADLERIDALIHETFDVLSTEDTAKRLGEAQFGYQSQHYVLKLPKSWLAIPSMADLGDLQVELQVRTLAQHMWAAASHKLQYKHEASVPPPLRRTINRVSALLETVDLEFDRVLSERKRYQQIGIPKTKGAEPLNVDLLASVLAETFPSANQKNDEDYEHLLDDLSALSVKTVEDLKPLLHKHQDAAIAEDRKEVIRRSKTANYTGTTKERSDRGVFFSHTGLARQVLREEFGKKQIVLFLHVLVINVLGSERDLERVVPRHGLKAIAEPRRYRVTETLRCMMCALGPFFPNF